MPWHRLNVGAPVILSQAGDSGQQQARGVVCERNDRRLRVVLNAEVDEADAGGWRADLANDEIAAERQRAALSRAAGAGGERLADLRRVLLGERPPRFQDELPDLEFERTLNDSQQAAVRFGFIRPGRGLDPRPARNRQDDDRRGIDLPGRAPRRQSSGLRAEQPGRR